MISNNVASLGTILGIWAHPDDETFMLGGLLSMATSNGQQVICVTATNGAGGVQDDSRWPAGSLGEIREKELAMALEIIGVTEHILLGYEDGGCDQVDANDAIKRISTLIDHYQPDTVVTFPPDGLTGHVDHKTVSTWVRAAVEASTTHPELYYATQTQESYDSFWKAADEKFNIYFATDAPVFVPQSKCDIYIPLMPEFAARKTAALKAMPSQYDAWFQYLGDKGVEAAAGTEALVLAAKWAYPSA